MGGIGGSRQPLVDPRQGDAADDASSPQQNTWFRLFGYVVAESSYVRLFWALATTIIGPGLALGFMPLVGTFVVALTGEVFVWEVNGTQLGVVAATIVSVLVWRPVMRTIETLVWTLNATLIQPAYVTIRELFIYVADCLSSGDSRSNARLRSYLQLGAATVLCLAALVVAGLCWSQTNWIVDTTALENPCGFFSSACYNAIVLLAIYAAIAFVKWGCGDALMAPAETGSAASACAVSVVPQWRIAHLSDLHIVGEPYGFRLESGRRGPRGNDRLRHALTALAEIDRKEPVDLVLISGDITDAGLSAEWVEFHDIVAAHAELAGRMLIVPGNHDLNIIDRTNPARIDFSFSRKRALRHMRMVSAIERLQGSRVLVMGRRRRRFVQTLSQALDSHRDAIADLANTGTLRASWRLRHLWRDAYPMIVPPVGEKGLGVILLNSNAVTSFSFTNALGMISARQWHGVVRAMRQYRGARWIILQHHHLMEYPVLKMPLSDRIGTALIDGTLFARWLRRKTASIVVMHGHRHFDWQGRSGNIEIISAPSTVMPSSEATSQYFYIHTFTLGSDGLTLARRETVDIP